MTQSAAENHLHTCIQKVATGPEYSKDISFDDARLAMQHILSGDADPVRTAIFLIALRMKRETADENAGVLQAMMDASIRVQCDTEELVDIADPYNGMVRGLPIAAFTAPLLAACGMPAFCHGLEAVAPKFGTTHRQVLAAAGVNVDCAPQQVAEQLANSNIAWGYLDQAQACPALHALVPLRAQMIKRTVITTLEVLLKPISAKRRTHLLTGYVHKAYPPTYAALARHAGYETAAIVKGVEGGVVATLRDTAKYYRYDESSDSAFEALEPQALGVQNATRDVPIPNALKPQNDGQPLNTQRCAEVAAQMGIDALNNQSGVAKDSLIYCAAVALHHTRQCASLASAADLARQMLASGAAKAHFNAHC